MSGPLNHTVGHIIRRLLLDLGIGVNETASEWAIFVDNFPNDPDKAINVNNTVGRLFGRVMPTKELVKKPGIQVRVRAIEPSEAFLKIQEIETSLNLIHNQVVMVGQSTYVVHAITQTSDILSLGKDLPVVDRRGFSINFIVSVRLTEQGTGTGTGT